jgi:Dolichyl-phosphate-mannose-protein mannosyltransferase
LRRFTPILAILLLAATTRIANSGHWPVWTDEGWSTWAASDHHFDAIIDKVLDRDRHPPLFTLSLSAWWTLVGDSRIALRFLSIAAGLLPVAAVYRIGADWFGHKAGQFAALLLSVLPIAVYYSQELRGYGWLALAVSLMTLFFLRYLRNPQNRTLVLYVLSVVFMLYTLYLGALVLALHVAVGLLAWHAPLQRRAALIGGWLAALILYVPWLMLMSRQLGFISIGIDGYPTTFAGLLAALGVLFGSQLALTAGAYALGAWQIVERRHSSVCWLAQMTLVLSGLGLLGLLFVANLRVGTLSPRTLSFLAPLLVLVSGYGLSLLNRRAGAVLALSLAAISLASPTTIQPRLDYHVAAQAVATEYTPGDLIVLETGWDDNAFRYELMLALGDSAEPQIIRTLPWVDNREPGQPVVPHVEDAIRAHRRVWVVNWLQPSQVIPYLEDGADGFVRVLARQTSTGEQYQRLFTDTTVRAVLFERPAADASPRMYGDMFALRGALIPQVIRQGDRLHVDLWWSALKPLPLDYSAGVFLLDSQGNVRTQHDGPPGDKPTTQWATNALTFDRHSLPIPRDLPPGQYRVAVQIYWYGDRVPLPVGGEKYAIIGAIQVAD